MRTILITGASSGIGLACVKKMSLNNRIILCSRSLSALSDIRAGLGGGKNILVYKVDVTQTSSVKKMFDHLKSLDINPDVLINSAGLALGLEELEKGQIEDWEQMINTNIKGLLVATKFVIPLMKERNSGHIINIGSIAGINSYSQEIVYSATKAAVKSISDGLRKEMISYKIKVTNIQPGLVNTNFSRVRFGGDVDRAQNVYKGIKALTAEDVADIIAYAVDLPEHVQINEITVTPLHQATVEIVHKQV